jgi:hypothetical protein
VVVAQRPLSYLRQSIYQPAGVRFLAATVIVSQQLCIVWRIKQGRASCGLTPPWSRRPKACFAGFRPRLMSNVRRHKVRALPNFFLRIPPLSLSARGAPSPLWLMLLPCLVVFGIAGFALSVGLGNEFLARYTVSPYALAILLGPLSIALAAVHLRAPYQLKSISTPVIRWLAYPLFTLVIAGVLYFASRGWVAGVSRALAFNGATLELTVLSSNSTTNRHGRITCTEFLVLRRGERTERLCADGLWMGKRNILGSTIVATGWASPLGFHIEALQRQGR